MDTVSNAAELAQQCRAVEEVTRCLVADSALGQLEQFIQKESEQSTQESAGKVVFVEAGLLK